MDKIKKCISNAILQYPTLYLKDTYELSELFVLDQLYLTIGNGYEWNAEGYLNSCEDDNQFSEIPDVFFKHKMYYINMDDDLYHDDEHITLYKVLKDKREFKDLLKKHFVFSNGNELIFYEPELIEYIKNVEEKFRKNAKKFGINIVNGLSCFNQKYSIFEYDPNILTPSKISKYSAISEFFYEKSAVNNEPIYIHPDNFLFIKKITEYAIKFYNDINLYKHDSYYREYFKNNDLDGFEKFRKKEIEFFKNVLVKVNNLIN